MPTIPKIQIQQTSAKIGMKTTPAKLLIEQPKADLNMRQEPLKVELKQSFPQLQIDSTKAWSALGKRPPLELTNIIYNETRRITMDTIAKIAQKGDRLAAINIQEDPIPKMAEENAIRFLELYYEGQPSYDNVDVNITPGSLDINWHLGKVEMNVQINKPQMEYIPGNVDIYMAQKNSLEIVVPKIDRRI